MQQSGYPADNCLRDSRFATMGGAMGPSLVNQSGTSRSTSSGAAMPARSRGTTIRSAGRFFPSLDIKLSGNEVAGRCGEDSKIAPLTVRQENTCRVARSGDALVAPDVPSQGRCLFVLCLCYSGKSSKRPSSFFTT